MKAVKKKLLAFALTLAMVLPALSQAMPVAADGQTAVAATGVTVTSTTGMFSAKEGTVSGQWKDENTLTVSFTHAGLSRNYPKIALIEQTASVEEKEACAIIGTPAKDGETDVYSYTFDVPAEKLGERIPFSCYQLREGVEEWHNWSQQHYLTINADPYQAPEPEADADYTAVDAALARVPEDLTVYTEESAAAVTTAVNAVVRDKKASEQAAVDAMAKAIEDAVAALVLKPVEPEKTELAITNNTGMFKAVSAYLTEEDGQTYLVMTLSGSGYKELVKGTYEQAVAGGDGTAEKGDNSWIHGVTNEEGKLEFKIPVAKGESYIPVVAVSNSYYTKYLNGTNPLERSFFPRQLEIDAAAKTLVTGDYEETTDFSVTSNVADFKTENTAETDLAGGPNSNNYKVQPVLKMLDTTYDKVTYPTVQSGKISKATVAITGDCFVISLINAPGQEAFKDKAPVELTFHVAEDAPYAEAGTDVVRTLTIDKSAKTIVIDGEPLTAKAAQIEDGVYKLPELSAGPSAMFNHFEADSRLLIVSGDTATIRFITDASTASIQKYSRIALGKSSELVETSYQAELPSGTTIVEGKLQPHNAGSTSEDRKDKYLFEVTLPKAEVEALLANDVAEDIYIVVWNNAGSSAEKIPGWYKPSKDIYLSLGTLGDKTEAPAEEEGFGFTLQVGVYEEGQDFHTASFDGVTYALKDAAGNTYEATPVGVGMIRYSDLSADNTYTFTASKEGWVVVKQGEWNTEAHAYEYIYTGESEINITITKADKDGNVSEYTHPGMVFRLPPREENVVDKALAEVPEDLNYDLFTDETAKALKDAIAAADPLEKDEEKLNAMAKAVTDALHGLIPKDGAYEVDITKYNGTPYYLFEGLGDSDKAAGKAILVVENGQMTARIVLKNQSYGQVALGTKDEVIAAATAAGKVPEGTIDLEMPEEKQTINGKEYKVTTGTIPVPALFTKIDYAYHSSNTTKYTYNTGWYDHGAMFLGNTLKPTEMPPEEPEEPEKTELAITNTTSMFKAVSAYLTEEDGQTWLHVALSSSGYKELFKGTYEEAVANGDGTAENGNDSWIHGETNEEGKLEFKIPVAEGENGVTIPVTAVSNSYYTKYLNGGNDLARAFYPRQLTVDKDAKTLVTGDYESIEELTITNNIKMFKPESAVKHVKGGPNSNTYINTIELTMGSDAYDKAFIGDGAAVKEDEVKALSADKVFDLGLLEEGSNTVAFHSSKKDLWYNREVVYDSAAKTLTFNDKPADYSAVDAAKEKVPEDLSAYTEQTAQAVKDAVAAVETGLNSVQQADVDAMARAIEDALANLAEKFTVKDEQGNPVELAENPENPAAGDTCEGKDGKSYDVVSVGDPDPATGSVPVTVAEYTYSFITENAEWTKGSSTPLLMTAKRSRGDENTFKRFTGVLIDGAKLGENDYTAEAGSVKISLAPAYLETLSTGKHTVKALMQDGEAEGEFTIKAAQVKPDDKQDKPAGKDGKTVNTGDSNAVVVWVTLLVLAAAVCTIISAMYRRRAR